MPIELSEDQNIVFVDGEFYIRDYILPPETVAFHEKTNRWTTFYSFFPEAFCQIGLEVASFLRGELFIHDRDELNYNRFAAENPLGQPVFYYYPSEVTVISNASPSENKVYQSLSEESSDIWEVEYMETENGQITRIPENAFTKGALYSFQPGHGTKENVHYANIPMDENSPGGIVNGSRMRDYSLITKFSYFKNKLTKLFAVNFNVTKSYRND